MRNLIMALALVFAMIQPASAAVYQQGIVYVVYDETGDKAPKNNADINSNGVPDVVEDIATQVNAAREVFNNVFNFPDPLVAPRFKNATSIEVDIDSKEVMKVNGQAFSASRKNSKHDPNERALHIRIANSVNPHKNPTMAHEYFHLIQYGATYFRNGWFLEGMARWAEDSVRKISKYPDGVDVPVKLNSKAAENKIFEGKYNVAGELWYPLAVNMKDKATIPSDIMNKYKYVDGSPVFHDNIIYGPNVMIKVLQVMKSKEGIAAEQFGGVQKWRKDGQRDSQNNTIMMDCVREVYNSKLTDKLKDVYHFR